MESSKTIGSEAFRTILLQGHNQFYGVITFSQRYKKTVYLGKIFWTQFDNMTNKKPNSLVIMIYGKYQWIKKFDKHLYPILYTSYAIKKIYKNFVEGTSVITGPKCNKGPICNKHLDPSVIKVPSVITFWTQA